PGRPGGLAEGRHGRYRSGPGGDRRAGEGLAASAALRAASPPGRVRQPPKGSSSTTSHSELEWSRLSRTRDSPVALAVVGLTGVTATIAGPSSVECAMFR